MKIIRGRKSGLDCVVELDNESYRTKLSLEKSLKIARSLARRIPVGILRLRSSPVSSCHSLRNHGRRRTLTNILRIIQARPCIAMERHL